jgi:hypothetical protein
MHSPVRGRWLTTAVMIVSFAVLLVGCAGPAGSPAMTSGVSSPEPVAPGSPEPASSPLDVGVVAGLGCGSGSSTGGDIDRPAGPSLDVAVALGQDFEGILASDAIVLGSFEGRRAVIVVRDQAVVFIGNYGEDGRIYQYTTCEPAGIKPRM